MRERVAIALHGDGVEREVKGFCVEIKRRVFLDLVCDNRGYEWAFVFFFSFLFSVLKKFVCFFCVA